MCISVVKRREPGVSFLPPSHGARLATPAAPSSSVALAWFLSERASRDSGVRLPLAAQVFSVGAESQLPS